MNGRCVSDQRADASSGEDEEFLRDVLEGLCLDQKALPGKYLWDETGSSLFDAICHSGRYYLTALEMILLRECAADVAAMVGGKACIVEFGSGASRKIRVLLDAIKDPWRYIAIDISGDFLWAAAERLRTTYPALEILHVCADYSQPFPALPIERPGPVLGFFPGNSVANLEPIKATELLTRVRSALAPGFLLVGLDHNGDPCKLEAAYGGPLMAAFHKNILVRMMRELEGADHAR